MRILHNDRLAVIFSRPYSLLVGIQQFQPQVCFSCNLSLYIKETVLIVIGQIGIDTDIVQMCLGIATIQIALAGNTRQAPKVLIFTIRTVTPAESLECD